MRRHLFEWRTRCGARFRPLFQRRTRGVILSVTTHPARLESFRLPLLSLLNQRARAQAVVVVLVADEFLTRELPAWLERLAQRGLIEILWAEGDPRSYAKLLPALARYPSSAVVTADDDAVYPSWWFEGLLRAARVHPGAVVGYRARSVRRRSGRMLVPYAEWGPVSLRASDVSLLTAAEVMLTGVGGILYPAGVLPPTALDTALARSLCPTADDVWLWAMELKAGVKLAVIGPGYVDFAAVAGSRSPSALMVVNIEDGANDVQISAVLDHFGLWSALDEAVLAQSPSVSRHA